MDTALERVIAHLSRARSVLFVTGAGISAESGIPTYRGIGGLYNDEHTEEGIPIEVALSGSMFRRRPELTWHHIHRIEQACRGASFNRAHEVLALLEGCFEHCWVLTQNVDGFHKAAGSKHVIDIHGDIHDLRCTRCSFSERVADYSQLAPCPSCPRCGAVLRPEVVLFEELLPPSKVALMERALFRGFDVVFSIGTSSLFPYINGPVLEAAARGLPTVEINPGRTQLSDVVDVRLEMGAVAAFEALWAARDRWKHG
ncbi:NAD-dependent protein deacylase [Archangium violaceum]|uniref:SIR2 family NAD-dependent protein deacylase n=1 Tax=Archangium violaceum TaxID=83451 RepID=UPI0019519CB8|nr:NAD-dependent protein deacylase [Archangium violaceum]QRN93430.1 NAD-dependent protein deacylase [Archangium violaceum]